MATIPKFQLYGEGKSFADPGFVHIETIESRSRRNDWEIRAHSHDTLDQLLVIRSGTAAAMLEDVVQDLRGPAVIHVPAHLVHGFAFGEDIDGDVLTFSVDLRGALAAQSGGAPLQHEAFAHTLTPRDLARLTPLLDGLHSECSGHAPGWIAATAWLLGLLLIQLGRIFEAESDAVAIPDTRVSAFRALVDRHFREHRPLAFYADALGITERTLTRLTRARFQCAPVQYLHRRLLLEARRQLVYGTQPIARISDELGFTDPSYFTRFYQRMTGEPPSAVRATSKS